MTDRAYQGRLRYRRRYASRNTKRREGKADRGGYVYILALGFDNLYKIGRASDVNERVLDLQAANPRLAVWHTARVADMGKAERVLHKRFKDQCATRECFTLSDDDLAWAKTFLESCFPPKIPEGINYKR